MGEWVKVGLSTERAKENCKSWFAPLCDDMMPVSAEILVDQQTNQTKKLKVVMRKSDGTERTVIRSWFANNRFSITFKPEKSNEKSHA